MADPFLISEGGSGIATLAGKYLKADSLTSDFDIQMFDLSVNLLQAILWQYNDAENLQALLVAKQAWYNSNQQAFWQGWIANVFNLDTADEFGLGVWSIILGLPNFINQSSPGPEIPVFGFDGSGGVNFDNGILAITERRFRCAVNRHTKAGAAIPVFSALQLGDRAGDQSLSRLSLWWPKQGMADRPAKHVADLHLQFPCVMGTRLRLQQSRYLAAPCGCWERMAGCDARVFRF